MGSRNNRTFIAVLITYILRAYHVVDTLHELRLALKHPCMLLSTFTDGEMEAQKV